MTLYLCHCCPLSFRSSSNFSLFNSVCPSRLSLFLFNSPHPLLLYWPPLTAVIILISFPSLNSIVSAGIQRGFPEIHLNGALFLSFVYLKSHKTENVIPGLALCGAAVRSGTQSRLIMFRNVSRLHCLLTGTAADSCRVPGS
jgi:hypothetical protein